MKKFICVFLFVIFSLNIANADGITIQARGAKKGVNDDITSMTGLDNDGIPLAKVANAASDGANGDITSLTGLDGSDLNINGGYSVKEQGGIDRIVTGTGYWFDLSNDSITTSDSPAIDVGLGDFSIELYFKPDSIAAANQFLINKEAGGIGYGLEQRLNDLWIRFDDDTADATAIIGTDVFLVGVNYHIVVTFDRSGNATAFINGDSVGTVDISGSPLTLDNAGAFTIGTETGGTTKPFGGTIYKVKLYNVCLLKSDPEQEAIINSGTSASKNEGAGQANKNLATIINNAGIYPYTTFSGASTTAFHAEGDGSTVHQAGTTDAIVFEKGKRYRLLFTYVNNSGSNPDFAAKDSALGTKIAGFGSPVIASGLNVYEFDCLATTTGLVEWTKGAASPLNFDISNFWVGEVGLTVDMEGVGHNTFVDNSTNKMHGRVLGAITTGLPSGHREKFIDLAVTGDINFTLPKGYIISSIILTSDGAVGGGIDIGTTDGGGEIVTAQAISGAGTVLCTLVAGANYNTTGADDTIYVTDADGTGWDAATVGIRVQMERVALN